MRVAIVIPWLRGIGGNRLAICLAAALADSHHDVTVVSDTVRGSLVDDVRRRLDGAKFTFLRTQVDGAASGADYARRQYLRRYDRRLARRIAELHQAAPFDVVAVLADEGLWLGEYLRGQLRSPRPILAASVMELVDHSFLLARERSHPTLRSLSLPAYPVVQWVARRRLRSFDLLFSVSAWTSEMLDYLYGIPAVRPLVVVDPIFYAVEPSLAFEPFIALPTVSLGPEQAVLARAIAAQGIPFIAYGPQPFAGVPNRGFIEDRELPGFLASASATLFLFDYEGLGLVPLESLAVGTPVVTLPRQGPHATLRSNPGVRFGTTAEDLAAHLRAYLDRPPSRLERKANRESMAPFTADRVAADFVARIAAAKGGRPTIGSLT